MLETVFLWLLLFIGVLFVVAFLSGVASALNHRDENRCRGHTRRPMATYTDADRQIDDRRRWR